MNQFKSMVIGAAAMLGASMSPLAQAAEEVNIYSYRQAFLIEPILEAFTEETGIKANVVFAKDGLIERLEREGQYSPADVMLTTDISRLMEMVNKDLSQPLDNADIKENVPAQYRDPDNHWFALTTRVRNVYASKERVTDLDVNYEDLAKPEFKGKICTRSGKHPYNVALVSSMIVHHGEAETLEWLEGLKANLARKPQGNDRDQVRAIQQGLCDYSLGNSYYFGKMRADEKQKEWADAVHILFPNQDNRGAHVNVSGMVLTKHAPNRDNAEKLMAFLTTDTAQAIYAEVNSEYPVKPGVPLSEEVASWGEFHADPLPIAEIAEQRQAALKLIDTVKFDL